MKHKFYVNWICLLLLSLLVPVILLSGIKVSGLLKEPSAGSSTMITPSNENLFRSVQDISVGTKGGYSLLSYKVFPLKVYVLDLRDVGNYRFSNHSDLIEGVRRAIEISLGPSQIKEFDFGLDPWGDFIAKLNVSVSFVNVENWTTYRTIIESESNAIVVNTYDEFLPVPDGYLKEAWVDKIADFMMNRWGTWVHVGGYPYYRIWFQNGTQVEWGEAGFQRLMSHIGKGNETCYPPNGSPEEWSSSYPVLESIYSYLGTGFRLWPASPGSECIPGFPLGEDFRSSKLFVMFDNGPTTFHAAIRFSLNSASFNFGVYVHLGTWLFREGGTDAVYARPAAFAGFLATAVAIYEDFSRLTAIYGTEGNSASEAIRNAQTEGKTVGLTVAMTLFQSALDAYSSGNYKMAYSYAMAAINGAQSASVPSQLPLTVTAFATVFLGTGASASLYRRRKGRRG